MSTHRVHRHFAWRVFDQFRAWTAVVLLIGLAASAATCRAGSFALNWGGAGDQGGVVVANAEVVDADGNRFVAGYVTGKAVIDGVALSPIGEVDAFVAKLDSSGTVVWARNFGGSGAAALGQAVAVDGNGNPYLGGYFFWGDLSAPSLALAGSQDAFVIRLNGSDGTVAWSRRYGGPSSTVTAQALAADGSGSVYLSGSFSGGFASPPMGSLGQDAFLLKLSAADGSVGWASHFGAPSSQVDGPALAIDGGGNPYLGGTCRTSNQTSLTTPALALTARVSACLFKINPGTGSTTWAKSFGGASAQTFGKALAVDNTGKVYLTGYYRNGALTVPALSLTGSEDAFLFKLNPSDGNPYWVKHYGSSGAATYGTALATDGNGAPYLGGVFTTASLASPALALLGKQDAFVFKVSPGDGSVTWAKGFGGAGATMRPHTLAVDGAGNPNLAGDFDTAALTTPAVGLIGMQDAFVFKLSATDGATSATGHYWGVGAANAYVQAAATDAAGNEYVAGRFDGSLLSIGGTTLTRLGLQDAFVAKVDSNGTVVWATRFGGANANTGALGLAIDGSGNPYVSGTFQGSSLGTPALTAHGAGDAFVVKLNAGDGSIAWAKSFGGGGATAWGMAVGYGGSGNLYLGGYFTDADLTTPALPLLGESAQNAFVIRLSPADGTVAWARSFGGGTSTAAPSAMALAVDGSGNPYLGGSHTGDVVFTGVPLFAFGKQDAFVAKLNAADGSAVWAKHFGGNLATTYGQVLAIDAGGNAYLGGHFKGADLSTPALARMGVQDAFVLKFDAANGNTTWARSFGGSGASTAGMALAIDSGGNAALGGYFSGASLSTPSLAQIGVQDAFALKLDAVTGNASWSRRLGGSGASTSGQAIAVDGGGNPYLGGILCGADLATPALKLIGGCDAFLISFAAPGSQFTVNYNGNGNTGGGVPVDLLGPYPGGSNVTVLGNPAGLGKYGYTFSGWNVQADGGGPHYAAGSVLAVNANIVLYAQWAPFVHCAVTYLGNGSGTGGPPSDPGSPHVCGSSVTVLGNAGGFTRPGYGFGGWNTKADGSGTSYLGGASLPLLSSTLLYAQWTTLPQYTVTYSGNGNTGGTVPVDAGSPHTSGSPVTVLGNTGHMTFAGRLFAGWNTQPNGGGSSYGPGATFVIGGNTGLHAQWVPAPQYVINYNGNGNTGGSVPVDSGSPYVDGSSVTAAANSGNLSRPGFTFVGWNTRYDGGGISYGVGAMFTIGANTTLHAQWLPQYSITYDGNGNTGGTAPVDADSPYASGSSVTVRANTGPFGRSGYAFVGWNTQANGSGTSYGIGATFAIGANTTLHAQWVLQRSVAYAGNGNTLGTAPIDANSPYPTGSSVTVLGNAATLSRTGYVFAGWNTLADGSGVTYGPGATFSVNANTTLYARWAPVAPMRFAQTWGGNANVLAVAADGAGHVYVGGTFDIGSPNVGGTTLTPLGTADAFIVKLDGAGNVHWIKTFGGPGALAQGWAIAVDRDGNPFLGGVFESANLTTPALSPIGMIDLFVIKLNAADGSVTWAKNFGGTFTMVMEPTLAGDTSGNLYVGGGAWGAGLPNGGDFTTPPLPRVTDQDAFVFKLDGTSGDIVWARNFGSAIGIALAADRSGNPYLAGRFGWSGDLISPPLTKMGSQDTFVLKLGKTDGGVLWAKSFGGAGALTWATALATDSAGNPYVGGFFWTADLTTPSLTRIGTQDAFVLKLDESNGSTVWARNMGGVGASVSGETISADRCGNPVLGGHFSSGNLTAPSLTRIGNVDAVVFGLNGADGKVAWATNFGGFGAAAYGDRLAIDSNGNGYLGGAFTTAALTNPPLPLLYVGYPPGENMNAFLLSFPISGTRYSLTYGGNGNTGGSVPVDSNSPYNGCSATAVLGNSGALTRSGYAFAGWNTQADGSGTSYGAGASLSLDANTTLHAQWKPIAQVTVAYSGNGHTGGTVPADANSPYFVGSTVSVLGNTGGLSKSGSVFSGWDTQADGGGARYGAGSRFTASGNATLHAQWMQIARYTVTYDGNGNTGGTVPVDGSSPYVSGATVTALGSGTMSRTGFIFNRWNTAANGSETAYAAGTTFTIAANTTLYAQWIAQFPVLDIDGNGNYDALTDGLLIIRYLLGLTDSSLTTDAIGPQPTRSTPTDIVQFLDNIRPLLDVDGNGQVEAYADGLMLIRYLFGLRGTALTAGAIGGGATRDGPQIEAYIQSLMP